MAIGLLYAFPLFKRGIRAALVIAILTLPSQAEDQLNLKNGTVSVGQITGVSGDQVFISIHSPSGSIAKIPFYLADIQSLTMATPPDVLKVQGAAPAMVIMTLEPLVKQFAGLKVGWVVDAMAQLADAYDASGQSDKASAIYNQINTLYPGSNYQIQAIAGQAGMSLKQGKVDEALAAVQQVVDKANQNIAASPDDAKLYAKAFLVYGQALEAQKKLPQALEAYLTVKTMYYQNPALAAQADGLAKSLRDRNPGLGIE